MSRLLLTLLLTNVVLIAGTLFFFNSKVNQSVQSDQELVSITFGTAVRHHHTLAQNYFDYRINTPKVKTLMSQANKQVDPIKLQPLRSELYQLFLQDYKFRSERFHLKQLHFHLPNNRSFLRFHRPNIYGDDLTEVRKSVRFVNLYHKPVTTFEEGRIFNGYRFVFPLTYQNKHLGSVETSVSIKALTHIFNNHLRAPSMFILKKELVDSKVYKTERKNYSPSQVSEHYVKESELNGSQNEQILTAIKQSELSRLQRELLLDQGAFFTIRSWFNESFYLTSFFPLYNTLEKTHSGYIIVSREHKEFVGLRTSLIYFIIIANLLMLMALLLIQKYRNTLKKLDYKSVLLEEVQDLSQIGTWEYNFKTDTLKWSEQTYHIFGTDLEQPSSLDFFYERIHPDDREHVKTEYERAIELKADYSIKHRIVRPDGFIRYVYEHAHIRFDRQGHISYIVGITKDITDLEEANLQLNEFINSQKDLTILTYSTSIDFANQAFLDFFGVENVQEFIAKHQCVCNLFLKQSGFFYLNYPAHSAQEWLDRIIALPQQQRIVLLKDIKGITHAFSVTVSPFSDSKVVASFNDITSTILEKQVLEDQVAHDQLTHAFSRQYLQHFLIKVQNDLKLGKHYYLILFDIDHFKTVNDQHGHLEGDQVLIELVKLVNDHIREEDRLVRWGGEEFIIIGESKNIMDLETFASHIRKLIENHPLSSKQQQITCSFGVTRFQPKQTFEEALSIADEALYQAKESGRNQVIIK